MNLKQKKKQANCINKSVSAKEFLEVIIFIKKHLINNNDKCKTDEFRLELINKYKWLNKKLLDNLFKAFIL